MTFKDFFTGMAERLGVHSQQALKISVLHPHPEELTAHYTIHEMNIAATGAGDALAAGFLVGGPQLALEAAARCVAKLGTMP